MTAKQYLGLLGFGFVVVWIAFSFGDALLCALGAAVFYAAGAVVQGDIDLAEVQDRLRPGDASPTAGFSRPAGARRRVR